MNKVIITWKDVEGYIQNVANRYKDVKITGVYGFARGGLVLAVMLSNRLDIPLLSAPVKDCIIIDDICDSGETLLHYRKNSSALKKPDYYITTMMYRNGAMVTPDYYWGVKHDDWIVFPWEKQDV